MWFTWRTQQEEEGSRKQYVGNHVHAIVSHPNKDVLFAELQSNNPCTPFSKESKHMIHSLGNPFASNGATDLTLFKCLHCIYFLNEGDIYCDWGTCVVPSEETRRLNKERYDVLTIPFFYIFLKGASRGARQGRSEDQIVFKQAREAIKKGKEKGIRVYSRSILTIQNPIAIRKLALDGHRTSASTWTLEHQKTTHTLPHGMKERDTKTCGQWGWTARERLQLQFNYVPNLKHWQNYVKWKRKQLRQGTN